MARPRQTLTPDHTGYPERLARTPDAPEFIRVLGDLSAADPVVAVVGARAASGHGQGVAREIGAAVADAGGLVVSGGALGIDAAAHRGALDSGREGATVAVLGGGLDHLYPATNRPLFAAILDGGGALVSPFDDELAPRAGTFVSRNRVIAAMADVVLVVEAGAGSGALHTATAAHRYGRVVAAVPGSPGTEALIAQGAAVVEAAADLWSALAGMPRRPTIDLPEGGTDEAAVLDALADAPRAADDLARTTGLSAGDVNRALTGLELEGLALLVPGRLYVRSTLARELMVR